MDEEEKKRKIQEYNERLQRTGTPPATTKVRTETGKLFHVLQIAEAELAHVLCLPSLPEDIARTLRRLIAEAETRCAERFQGKIEELEELKVEHDRLARESSKAAFEWSLERRDLLVKIEALERKIENLKKRPKT